MREGTEKRTRPRARRAARGVEMPAGYQELLTKGVLMPDPDDPHCMKCAKCGLPVALILNKPPSARVGKTLPAGVWGEEVSVVCACCSFDHCTHRGISHDRSGSGDD